MGTAVWGDRDGGWLAYVEEALGKNLSYVGGLQRQERCQQQPLAEGNGDRPKSGVDVDKDMFEWGLVQSKAGIVLSEQHGTATRHK